MPFAIAASVALGLAFATWSHGTSEEDDLVLETLRTQLQLAQSAKVQWMGSTALATDSADLDLAVLALEDALGDPAARQRFASQWKDAHRQLASGGRIAVVPRAAELPLELRTRFYLDCGQYARIVEGKGFAFEREVALRGCEGRRAAWIFAPSEERAPLDPESLPALATSFAGQRVLLLSEAPTRANVLRALHQRGMEQGVHEWLLAERWSPEDSPSETLVPRVSSRRRSSAESFEDSSDDPFDAALFIDGAFGALDLAQLLRSAHQKLKPAAHLWILERCEREPLTPLVRSARRGIAPEELFRQVIAAGFAVRAIEDRGDVIALHAMRMAPAELPQRAASFDPWIEGWKAVAPFQGERAHFTGSHQVMRADDLKCWGFSKWNASTWSGPTEPVDLLVVAGWSHHPEPALFIDRPREFLRVGGRLAVLHDARTQPAASYADPDVIMLAQPSLHYLGELSASKLGVPDAALWLFEVR